MASQGQAAVTQRITDPAEQPSNVLDCHCIQGLPLSLLMIKPIAADLLDELLQKGLV